MSAEDYHKAASVESVNGETIPAGRELSAGEIAALLGSCENDPTPAGARDAAVIAVMYAAGLRREEMVILDLSDYDQESGRLVVSGKRRKDRTAYLLNGASHALNDWLDVRGSDPGSLFMPINKAGAIQRRRMTTQAIYNLLNKRASQAGIDSFSPHDLRRTFVSDLLDAGADIAIVAKMAGHASVNTTARYDRRPEAAKMKAAQRLHVPYHGRK
jgi:site-specific recombinase XerD